MGTTVAESKASATKYLQLQVICALFVYRVFKKELSQLPSHLFFNFSKYILAFSPTVLSDKSSSFSVLSVITCR